MCVRLFIDVANIRPKLSRVSFSSIIGSKYGATPTYHLDKEHLGMCLRSFVHCTMGTEYMCALTTENEVILFSGSEGTSCGSLVTYIFLNLEAFLSTISLVGIFLACLLLTLDF